MQLFYEIFPIFLFFISFKFYGIYVATVVGIVTTFIQMLFNRLYFKKWDKKQVITFFVFFLFGGMTLYFHNPIFVKWKPTIVFWIFGVVIIATQLFTSKTLMQRMMEPMLEEKIIVPLRAWQRLNIAWALFFMALGVVNLYIAYNYSNDAWVNFKFYGITGAFFILSIFQAIYLLQFNKNEENKNG
jgi:intracellular septation protein